MNFNQLNYFYKAAQYHSINKAAKELFLTPSALSLSISSLEKELGYKLFHRDNTGIFLTHSGELFLEDVKAILRMEENWRVIAKNSLMPHKATVRMSAIPVIYNSIMGDIIIRTVTENPNINFLVLEETVSEIEESLYSHQISCAIQAYIPDQSTLKIYARNIGYAAEPLYVDHYVAFVGFKNPLFQSDKCTVEELLEYTGLTMSYFSVNRFEHQQLFDPENTIYFHNQFALIQYLAESTCFTILPEILKNNVYCKSGKIKALPIEDVDILHGYALISPPENTITKLEVHVANQIRQYFKNLNT